MVCHEAIFVAEAAKNYGMIGAECTLVDVPQELPRWVFTVKFFLFLEIYMQIENHTILVPHLFELSVFFLCALSPFHCKKAMVF